MTGYCLEGGRDDEDCCGHKDDTSCDEGFSYSRGDSCGSADVVGLAA